MLIIDTPAALARALDQPLDPDLRRLLELRREQAGAGLEAARFIIVEVADTTASVEAAIGFPLLLHDGGDVAPAWEWAERHDGGWIEVVFVLSDDGPADVLLVPERDGTDADLINLLHLHAADDLERQHATAP